MLKAQSDVMGDWEQNHYSGGKHHKFTCEHMCGITFESSTGMQEIAMR